MRPRSHASGKHPGRTRGQVRTGRQSRGISLLDQIEQALDSPGSGPVTAYTSPIPTLNHLGRRKVNGPNRPPHTRNSKVPSAFQCAGSHPAEPSGNLPHLALTGISPIRNCRVRRTPWERTSTPTTPPSSASQSVIPCVGWRCHPSNAIHASRQGMRPQPMRGR